jgi:hypothetical protein
LSLNNPSKVHLTPPNTAAASQPTTIQPPE